MQCRVGLGQVGEDLGNQFGHVLTGDLHRGLTEADGQQVLVALGAQLGHVGERDGDEASPRAAQVGLEGRLVRDDRPIGVADAVMNGGDGVEEIAEICQIVGRAVDLQCLQQALERL